LIFRTFFELYQKAEFTTKGVICGLREEPMASKTVRNATGSLGTKFRDHLRWSTLAL
jgi:hypothetical protein